MIAIEEPDSSSGYMLPLAILIEAGFKPVEKETTDATVMADEVGFVFSGDDDNTAIWVFEGRVAAGSIDNDNFEAFAAENPGVVTSFFETEPLSRAQLVSISPKTDPALVEAITTLLLQMHETEEGAAALLTTETIRFEAFLDETDITRAREMYDLVMQ